MQIFSCSHKVQMNKMLNIFVQKPVLGSTVQLLSTRTDLVCTLEDKSVHTHLDARRVCLHICMITMSATNANTTPLQRLPLTVLVRIEAAQVALLALVQWQVGVFLLCQLGSTSHQISKAPRQPFWRKRLNRKQEVEEDSLFDLKHQRLQA